MADYCSISLAEAIEITGTHKAVAAACGVSLAMTYYWTRGEKPISTAREAQIRAAIDARGGTPDAALRQVADITQALLESWADNQITPAECAMIEEQGKQAIIELFRAIRLARQAQKGGAS